MTDTTTTTPTTTTPTTPRPPSIRRGTPRDIASISCIRNKNRHTESLASYLSALDDTQADLLQNKKTFSKDSLAHQLDMLDAMFTYLSIHADQRSESSLCYMTALRSQRQFCQTLKLVKELSANKKKSDRTPTGQK